MNPHLYITRGDLTSFAADAIAFSTGAGINRGGMLANAFIERIPEFDESLRALSEDPLPRRIGDARWLSIPGWDRPKGVIVVIAVARTRASVVDDLRMCVFNALRCAATRLGNPPPGKRWLIALPTFLLGWGGAGQRPNAAAKELVLGAREALAEIPGVDACFVCFDTRLHHILLRARRRYWPELFEGISTPPTALVDSLRERECVLFVGAGLSAAAGLPSWNALVSRLAEELGLPTPPGSDFTYEQKLAIAELHRAIYPPGSPNSVGEIIRELFLDGTKNKHPTLAHYLLLGSPLRTIVTTNYDPLLERALDGLRKPFRVVISTEEVARTGRQGRVNVVKLHGDAGKGDEVVLSRRDYDGFFEKRPAMALLLEGLLLNQSFFFVGYSLADENFRRIYDRIAGMLRGAARPAFVATLEARETLGPPLPGLQRITFSGETFVEREQQMLRWFDLLSELSAQEPPVFLAPRGDEVPQSVAHVEKTRLLLEELGKQIEGLSREDPLPPAEADVFAQLLSLLLSLGWRPQTRSRFPSLVRLLCGDNPKGPRARLLAAALEHTEHRDDADLLAEVLPED